MFILCTLYSHLIINLIHVNNNIKMKIKCKPSSSSAFYRSFKHIVAITYCLYSSLSFAVSSSIFKFLKYKSNKSKFIG